MDAVFPTGKERYWIYVYVLVVLYLAVLGFGIGVLLGKAFRFAMNKSN
jgi:VIT1/CCC1 family predicted Fe2+/Mn2+ transporter